MHFLKYSRHMWEHAIFQTITQELSRISEYSNPFLISKWHGMAAEWLIKQWCCTALLEWRKALFPKALEAHHKFNTGALPGWATLTILKYAAGPVHKKGDPGTCQTVSRSPFWHFPNDPSNSGTDTSCYDHLFYKSQKYYRTSGKIITPLSTSERVIYLNMKTISLPWP